MLGNPKENLKARYERNGWPAQTRPDIKPVAAWSIPMLASITRPRAHVISPDGSRIAFYWDISDSSDLYVISSTGGWPQRLTFDREPVAYWADAAPQWSPDSNWIAYTNGGHVWVITAEGGKPQKVTTFSTGGGSPRWMPDSNGLLVTIGIEDCDRLVLTDRQGNFPRLLTKGPGHDHSPSVSPNGTQVAYVHQPLDDFNRSDIMWVDVNSAKSQAITGTPKMHDAKPQWSPDGRSIAFISERPGFNELFLFDRDTGQERQLTHVYRDIVEYAWSPDSQQLLCTLNNKGAFDLILVSANSGEVTPFRIGYGVHAAPHWMPDGKSVTFEYEDAHNPPDIFRVAIEDKLVSQLTFSKPPVLSAIKQVMPERINYRSFDGMEIPAFLYRPENPNGAAIVYPHGGPTSQYVLEWDGWAQYFVAKGYTWLAPNFRGSTGYGIEFERSNHGVWGVDDTKDCLAAADYLAGLKWIDAQRIGIFGASYGSYMATCALAYDEQHRFALGVAKYGDCNILSSWAQSDLNGREDLERMMQHPSLSRAAYKAGSPIWQAANIEKPLFIAHGLLDDRVHPLQAEELVEGLKRHDKVFEYITYADEGHGFLRRSTRIDFYSRLERFFDWYLL
jgi:dipeptidyl aminopeptidase/acylaminoacyl peptidase